MPLLRVDTAGVQAMAARWAASVGELAGTEVPPAWIGFSCQASAAAVNAAHIEVTEFTAALAARVGAHAAHIGEADAGYVANEADAANALASVAPRVTGV
ncbi:hypothetical protein A5646_21965 [Mycobacterium sp. 1245499.0]|uniref:hypothetical protein n=1 Tax=unclassified Mycobacterium TaxID=2642494 RepID=UPI0007FC9E44|nr:MULTISPECIES: hypothetical protein [unclassified Mycobacterium]OBJ21858.1 hypothetical protein A5622_16895 [Mycobacterium sp. 1245801.1]OBK99415.1 hypothetical protein A5646_21965 [Mycobacterium sp. 1245499.0]